MVMRGLVAALLIAGLIASPACAHLPPDVTADPEMRAWFERQHSATGGSCCDLSDGNLLHDAEWRMEGSRYEVKIGTSWFPISENQLRDPKGGPNPTGQAIVWFAVGEWGVHIFCFAPGNFY